MTTEAIKTIRDELEAIKYAAEGDAFCKLHGINKADRLKGIANHVNKALVLLHQLEEIGIEQVKNRFDYTYSDNADTVNSDTSVQLESKQLYGTGEIYNNAELIGEIESMHDYEVHFTDDIEGEADVTVVKADLHEKAVKLLERCKLALSQQPTVNEGLIKEIFHECFPWFCNRGTPVTSDMFAKRVCNALSQVKPSVWKKYPDEIPENYDARNHSSILLLHENKGIMHDQLQWDGEDECYHLREYEFYPIREKSKIIGYIKDSFTHWCYEADLISTIKG